MSVMLSSDFLPIIQILLIFSLCFKIARPKCQSSGLRWRQICPLKINIFSLNAPISTNKVSIFKLAIEVYSKNYFELIHAIFMLRTAGRAEQYLHSCNKCVPLVKNEATD